MHAGDTRHESLYRVVWPCDAPQQVEDREHNGNKHAVEHTEHQHGRGGCQGENQFAVPKSGQPLELWHIDQA